MHRERGRSSVWSIYRGFVGSEWAFHYDTQLAVKRARLGNSLTITFRVSEDVEELSAAFCRVRRVQNSNSFTVWPQMESFYEASSVTLLDTRSCAISEH